MPGIAWPRAWGPELPRIRSVYAEIGEWSRKAGFKDVDAAKRMWRFTESIGIRPEAYLAFLKAETRD